MMTSSFTVHIRNLRVLQRVKWAPSGVSVLVGANGSGKTTLLLSLKLIRAALDRGLPDAVTGVLGGSHNLRNLDSGEGQSSEPIELGLDVNQFSWRIRLIPHGPTVNYLADESLKDGNKIIFEKDNMGKFRYRGKQLESDERIGLRTLLDAHYNDPAIEGIAGFIRGIAVFHDPDLWSLRINGSRTTDDRHLHSRGSNAFTMLRKWMQEKSQRQKYQFVLDGLRAAFPELISDIDFKEAGQTIVMQTYRGAKTETPLPIGTEANGVLQMLVLLCNIAQAEPGSLVAIDEPENSLHPYAVRSFLRFLSTWAKKNQLIVILTTHSTVLLDQFNDKPSQVYILASKSEKVPVPLNEFKDPNWLSRFRIGELYADSELGSNDDKHS